MKKRQFFSIICFFFLFTGCVSVGRARRLIEKNDNVSAIEVLSKRLQSKKDDAEAIELFVEIYPSTVEEYYTNRTVRQIREDFSSKYNSSETQAIKSCRNQISSLRNLLSHPDISNVIKESNNTISRLSSLVRIQKAVLPLPRTIGSSKTGEFEVYKYNDDFSGMYATAKYELGEFYNLIADTFYPGTGIDDRIFLIDVYKKADSYSNYSGQSASKCAELCYLNGRDYETLKSVDGYKKAISWYRNSYSWVRGYRDTNQRIQILSYEIAILLTPYAKTKDDYREIISYFEAAGDYKDASLRIIEMKYYLAYLYRADHTVKSYEEAGKLFSQLGNYKRSALETYLYDFYTKLKSLNKNHSYGGINLSSGNFQPFTMTRNMSPVDDTTSTLSLSCKTSAIDAYIPSMENIIYPASIINGEAITNQTFTPFNYGSRNPVDFSLSSSGRALGNGTISNSREGNASVKEVRRLANKYAKDMTLDASYEFHKIYSPEDLALTTGIGAGREKVSYSINFNNWNPEKSYTLVKVTQKFYSTAINPPLLPVDFFAVNKDVVTASSLRNVTPYYVSSVDYGRKAFFVICSDLPSEEIIKDFTACRPRDSKNSGATGMRVNPEISDKWQKAATYVSSITVSEKIYSINDLSGIYNWIKTGTSMSVEADEIVPIAFTLRSLKDNSFAILSQSNTVKVKVQNAKPVNEVKTEESSAKTEPAQTQPQQPETQVVPTYDGDFTPAAEPAPAAETEKPAAEKPKEEKPKENKPKDDKPKEEKPVVTYEKETTINGTKVPETAYNGSSSLIFVGKKGYYTCSQVTTEQGSGVKTWYYNIPQDEVEVCVASWNASEFSSVTVNGIQMTMNKTVYSFRDVRGNTISLDFITTSGERIHSLLVVR